jgi:hypothetical protein
VCATFPKPSRLLQVILGSGRSISIKAAGACGRLGRSLDRSIDQWPSSLLSSERWPRMRPGAAGALPLGRMWPSQPAHAGARSLPGMAGSASGDVVQAAGPVSRPMCPSPPFCFLFFLPFLFFSSLSRWATKLVHSKNFIWNTFSPYLFLVNKYTY